MKHLYFIRHGESEMNMRGLSSGRIETPLTDKGILQAIEAGQLVKKSGIKFDAILTSPLSRAHHTASYVATESKHSKNVIEIHEGLIERDFGELEGKNMKKDFNIDLAYYYDNPSSTDQIPRIETLAQLHRRAEELYKYLQTRPEETILLVGHSAFLRSLQRVIHNLPYDQPLKASKNATLIKLV